MFAAGILAFRQAGARVLPRLAGARWGTIKPIMSARASKTDDEGRGDWIHGIAERKIKEAIEEGLFDNLPGKGKPLELDDDPLTPPHLRVVHHVLKNANVVPEWILREREIERAKQATLDFLARWEAKAASGNAQDRAKARADYERLMRAANDLILKFNLVNPFVHRAPVPFRIRERLARWDERYGNEPDSGGRG